MVAVAILAALGWGCWRIRRLAPQRDGTLRLAGLLAPAQIVRDELGVAHIRAANLHDLYLAEGYAMAQDRLWQMDLLRRLAEGRLAAIFGPLALPKDEQTWTLRLPQVAARESAALPPADRALLVAFSAGVNDCITQSAGRLPAEFGLLHYQPAPWRPLDSVAFGAQMYRSLSMSYKDELLRAALIAAAGPVAAAQALPDRSPWDIIPGQWPLFLSPAAPARASRSDAPVPPAPDAAAKALLAAAALAPASSTNLGVGSNNWVLGPKRSLTGKPILANDVHLDYQTPGLWWTVELSSPQLRAAGVTFAGVPGVIVGHNDRIAWGLTKLGDDVQDLYAENISGVGAAARVQTSRGWLPLQTETVSIPVRGQAPVHWLLRSTPRGPIVAEVKTAAGEVAYALHWSLYDPGSLSGIFGMFLRLTQARDWSEFEAAVAQFPGPGENFVYADTSGNIGYQAGSRIPIRAGAAVGNGGRDDAAAAADAENNADLPAPAEDADAWVGWIPAAQLPRVYDPPDQILATANGRVAPDDYRYFITDHWDAPYRTRRIYQLLLSRPRWSPARMAQIQTDVVSPLDLFFARQILAAASRQTARPAAPAGRAPRPGPAAQGLALLRAWNGAMDHRLVAPTLANETRHEFLRRVLAAKFGAAAAAQYDWSESGVFAQWLLNTRPADWLPAGAGDWDGLLLACYRDVAARLAAHGSLRPARARWGLTAVLSAPHPVYSHVPLLALRADLGPVEIDGDHFTVKQTTRALGPSLRFVADLADWDRSTLTLFSGENGEPFGRHYRDQFAAYLLGRALPLWFSPAAVRAHARHRLGLLPAS